MEFLFNLTINHPHVELKFADGGKLFKNTIQITATKGSYNCCVWLDLNDLEKAKDKQTYIETLLNDLIEDVEADLL